MTGNQIADSNYDDPMRSGQPMPCRRDYMGSVLVLSSLDDGLVQYEADIIVGQFNPVRSWLARWLLISRDSVGFVHRRSLKR